MRIVRFAALPFVAACAFIALPANAEVIRTRAPQTHVDAFLNGCKAKSVPTATCTCMLEKLSATREGDAALDAMGLFHAVTDEQQRKAALLPLLNRHAMRPSELKAAMDPQGPTLSAVLKQCQ